MKTTDNPFKIGDQVRYIPKNVPATIRDFEHSGVLRAVLAIENRISLYVVPLTDIELLDGSSVRLEPESKSAGKVRINKREKNV